MRINKAIIAGRLGQDPKITFLPNGNPVAEFTVATDESYKDRDGNKVDGVEWHRVKAYGKIAEFCEKHLGKGLEVYIEGKIKTRSWEDQQGQKRYITEIVVSGPKDSVQPVQWKNSDEGQGQGDRRSQGASQGQNRGGYSQGQGQQARGRDDDQGPAFPSEASGMDDVPF